MEHYFQGPRLHHIHLVRRDLLAQAVSYYRASRTREWSSEFLRGEVASYDFAAIENRLRRIQDQNSLIQAFLRARGFAYETIYYEDVVAHTEATLRRIPGVSNDQALNTSTTLRRQAVAQNREWVDRFASDLLHATMTARSGWSVKGALDRLLFWARRSSARSARS
jgi:LPS sulfotransferase NodH